jgi:hypothetical protein
MPRRGRRETARAGAEVDMRATGAAHETPRRTLRRVVPEASGVEEMASPSEGVHVERAANVTGRGGPLRAATGPRAPFEPPIGVDRWCSCHPSGPPASS